MRRAHGEFVHVQLAQHHGTRSEKLGRDGGFVFRPEALEDVRRGLRRHALGAEQILDAQRECRTSPGASPAASRASAARACSSAISGVLWTKAFSSSPASIAVRQAIVRSTAVISPCAQRIARRGDGQLFGVSVIPPPSARQRSLRGHRGRSSGSAPECCHPSPHRRAASAASA